MKKIILFLILIFIIGCAQEIEEPEEKITCEEYCKKQPHVMCVGDWEISGEYPDCNCKFICETKLVEVS